MTIYTSDLDSPIGRLRLYGDRRALLAVLFDAEAAPAFVADEGPAIEDARAGVLPGAIRQLREYFDGTRREFDLPLAPRGTPFQQTVWRALRRIPYGRTLAYGELARRIGKPGAARAVGMANHHNPLSIVVPCHRVIGADGGLTGYGGGLDRKRWLLALEHGTAIPAPRRSMSR
ncbi:MAG: methylated-DNA--[protein]-cysteine S-methyltransferase [Gammaproteobacteria bacterium]|nr:methylated-DNA--[protein]-cysteine S-methyltransferase [Gammaproteobacteria bacterium]